MVNLFRMFRSTVVGGILFLAPIILLVFLLAKGMEAARKLASPAIETFGVHTVAGVAASTICGVAAMVLVAALAGLFAQTQAGQRLLSSFENSILGVLPQFRMARGLAESLDPDHRQDIEIVLVPTDAGWQLGMVLEPPDGDYWAVFLPGAPEWSSGSISYAHRRDVRRTSLTFGQAILLMRRCGAGTQQIRRYLEACAEEGSAAPAERFDRAARSATPASPAPGSL